jgi:hypothetical protein
MIYIFSFQEMLKVTWILFRGESNTSGISFKLEENKEKKIKK